MKADRIRIQDTYKSISAPSEGLFKDNGSRFIAQAFPVESEIEIKEIIASVKKEYHDARHHCYAYRIGYEGEKHRANDDGEPSSSAGRPILGQIDSAGLSDILVVVTRYFGGIKLGIPGLIRAYKSSACDAIRNADVIEKIAGKKYHISFGYEKLDQIMRLSKNYDLAPVTRDFGTKCTIIATVRLSFEEDFLKRISEMEGCEAYAL